MKSGKNPIVAGATEVGSKLEGMWRATPRKRLWAILGIAGGLAVLAVGFVAYRRLPHSTPLEAVRQTVAPTLEDLQKEAKLNPKDVQTQVALGQAYFDKGQKVSALAAFERALKFDPKSSTDAMAADLVACFGTPEQAAAANLISSYHLVQTQEGLEKLTVSKQYAVRTAALAALQKMGRASHVDYFHVWTLDLQVPDCETRRHALSKLADLGDRRAIPAIHEAKQKDDAATAWYAFKCIGGRAEDAEKKIIAHAGDAKQPASAVAKRE
jgi:tetratricopeptide (TPR) repeat protein